MNRNDLYGMLTPPDVRTLEGIVTRIAGTQIFVTCPGFDGNSEFGPVGYAGATPALDSACIIAVINNTTESWLLSWDGANYGVPLDTWHPFPFAAGYHDYNGFTGGYANCAFTLDPWGFVHLKGLFAFAAGSYAPAGTVGILPVGYRPQQAEIFHVSGSSTNDYHFRFDVQADGAVIWRYEVGANWDGAYMSMSGITFRSATAPAYMPTGPAGPVGPAGPAGAQQASEQRVWTPAGSDAGSGNFTVANPFTDALGNPARIDFTPPTDGMITFEHETIYRNLDGAYQRLDTWIDIVRVSDGAILDNRPLSIISQYLSVVWQTNWTKNTLPVSKGVPIYGLAKYGGAISGTWNYWQGASYQKMRMLFTPTPGVNPAPEVYTPYWTPFVYQNGWTDYMNTWERGGWHRDPWGFVHLRGLLINPSAPTTGQNMVILPPQARPRLDQMFEVPASASAALQPNWDFRVDVGLDGHINWSSSDRNATGAYLSLNGITYQGA